MRLCIMRHGQAEPIAPTDELRPLTQHGKLEVAAMARQHLAHQYFDQVYVSPYLRAQQSWEQIRAQGVRFTQQQTVDWITPDSSPQTAADELLDRAGDASAILLVCHQPIVGRLTTYLCEGHDQGMGVATGGLVTMETEVVARQCATLGTLLSP